MRFDFRSSLTLVNIGLGVVRLLVLLVNEGILSSGGPGAETRIIVLRNLLVGLLRGFGTGALDSLGDVLGGVLDTIVSQCRTLDGARSPTLTVSIVKNRRGFAKRGRY